MALMQRSSSERPDGDCEARGGGGADERWEGAAAVSAISDIGAGCYTMQKGKGISMDGRRVYSLEASSYQGALQRQPVLRLLHFAGDEIVAAQLPLEADFRPTRLKQSYELLDAGRRNDRIHTSR